MSFDSKINNWIKTLNKRNDIFRRAIVENQEEILDLNVAQLEKGEDAAGGLLQPPYKTEAYAELKQGAPYNSKAPFGIADLKYEGDFYAGFVIIDRGNNVFGITSTDPKTSELEGKYGASDIFREGAGIFGLQDVSINVINPLILESFLIRFRNELL